MREYKFRAWDKKERKMRLIETLYFDGEKESTLSSIRVGLQDERGTLAYHKSTWFQEVELMQFTGLHDKNGREIYEGDIVAKGHWRYGLNPHNTLIGVVIYEPPFFCLDKTFIPKVPDDGCNGSAMDISEELINPISNRGENILEVIGNIHENGEFLK